MARECPPEQNCIDIIVPFVDAARQPDMPPYQVLGGVGSVALRHELTVIDSEEKRIIAPADLYESNYRPDGNLRDFEVLVMSTDPEDQERTQKLAKELVYPQLLIDIFQLHLIDEIDPVLAKPLGRGALMMFLSDRYLREPGTWSPDGPQAERILFPFATQIPHEALETWKLQIGEEIEFPVPAPGAVIVNYLTRSISGLRTKDAKKVQEMAATIFDKAPETLDWIIDGPGSTQFEFARILHTLRESKRRPKTLMVGGKLALEALETDLLMHPANMLIAAESEVGQKALQIAQAKSRVLHYGESIGPVVKIWQRYIEPRIKSVIHNLQSRKEE